MLAANQAANAVATAASDLTISPKSPAVIDVASILRMQPSRLARRLAPARRRLVLVLALSDDERRRSIGESKKRSVFDDQDRNHNRNSNDACCDPLRVFHQLRKAGLDRCNLIVYTIGGRLHW
jgi:hypothetical protein